jgi:predicted Zn-dependent peptidase
VIGLRFGTLLCLGALLLPAQELRDYEKKVTEFTLANGLHFILLERRQVPVVSFHTYVNAGSAQDPAGGTGLASLLARLAFDGTETIGTKNWPAEKKAMEDTDAAYDRLEEERDKGSRASAATLSALQAGVSLALTSAFQQQNPDEFPRAIQENGGVGVNSHATPDSIETSYSLPSNRIELWFVLESQRLAHPVLRDFFRERQKMAADISGAVESRTAAKLQQALLATAFAELPYRNPPLGWPSDVGTLRPADAKAFLDTYCGPGNTVISIVGDVDPANAQRLAERYFGPIPARARPPAMRTQELPQLGPKTVVLWGDTQPLLMIGYKRPPETHRDDAALDLIAFILGDSRTGWMHKELVEEKQIAQGVEAVASFPSARYMNLFVLSVTPARDHTVEENRKAVDDLVARLQSKPIDAETLARVKNVLRGRVTRILGSNQQLAALLPHFYANYGDWRRLFTVAPEYDKLTAEALQRVALQYLIPSERTVAYITSPPQPGSSPSNPGGPQ